VTERLEVLLLSPDVNDKDWCDAAKYTLHDMDREFVVIEAETLRSSRGSEVQTRKAPSVTAPLSTPCS
jgi:hypothetical protein